MQLARTLVTFSDCRIIFEACRREGTANVDSLRCMGECASGIQMFHLCTLYTRGTSDTQMHNN